MNENRLVEMPTLPRRFQQFEEEYCEAITKCPESSAVDGSNGDLKTSCRWKIGIGSNASSLSSSQPRHDVIGSIVVGWRR